ncbi:imidazole glycerol phosphate synthase subunit HisH [Gracilibacillus alcaliphilus]|uniref:imidazole glycerol phosphate synthase subunit HisH n=1 Tax=Gracilibacillus alcaliphilus TaxID=1401441 RepID=UPI001957295C|nr:imidazole glycerol phosphate synthase subunit HisH [Gracilibacillus alcaliphilus]MBM7676682.1 glutamine amidotransferase [Gracilibacillus alcaliphilus]
MIAIVDYGMGNIASVRTAFERLGYQVKVTDQPELLRQASHIILPGVGSFQAAVAEIKERQLTKVLQELAEEKPFLGICLGMQLLFETGYENGITTGLGLIPGEVKLIETPYILPHIGWNQLDIQTNQPELEAFQDQHVYFVHSFQAVTVPDYLAATAVYGAEVPAIVRKGNVFGMQFHPEKSGPVGVQLLKTFLEITEGE